MPSPRSQTHVTSSPSGSTASAPNVTVVTPAMGSLPGFREATLLGGRFAVEVVGPLSPLHAPRTSGRKRLASARIFMMALRHDGLTTHPERARSDRNADSLHLPTGDLRPLTLPAGCGQNAGSLPP